MHAVAAMLGRTPFTDCGFVYCMDGTNSGVYCLLFKLVSEEELVRGHFAGCDSLYGQMGYKCRLTISRSRRKFRHVTVVLNGQILQHKGVNRCPKDVTQTQQRPGRLR